MNYGDSLEVELAAAGIPARRRARIVAGFSDHSHENPQARPGAPRALARQFADEPGNPARAGAPRFPVVSDSEVVTEVTTGPPGLRRQ